MASDEWGLSQMAPDIVADSRVALDLRSMVLWFFFTSLLLASGLLWLEWLEIPSHFLLHHGLYK